MQIFAAFFSFSIASAGPYCAQLFPIVATNVKVRQVTETNSISFVNRLLGDDSPVYIGIFEQHYFLGVGELKFESSPLTIATIQRQSGGVSLREATIIALKDVPPAIKMKIQNSLNEYTKTANVSCVHTALKVLFRNGLVINDGRGEPVRLAEAFSRMVRSGFATSNGKVIDFQIVQINVKENLEEIEDRLEHRDLAVERGLRRAYRDQVVDPENLPLLVHPLDLPILSQQIRQAQKK